MSLYYYGLETEVKRKMGKSTKHRREKEKEGTRRMKRKSRLGLCIIAISEGQRNRKLQKALKNVRK